MNRRSFLKFAGLAPVVLALAVKAIEQSKQYTHEYVWDQSYRKPMFKALESGKKGDVIACKMWNDDRSDPISDIETAMKILERTSCNNPRHYAVSPGEWRTLKDLELIE